MGNKQSSTSTTTKNNNNMGCSESKQQTTSSSGPSSSTVARNLASRAAAGGGAAVDVVVQKSMMPKKQQQQQQQQQDRAHHLKNIFASPLGEVADNYKPPSYSKTKSEQEFLKTAVQANFVFSSVDSKKMQIIINAFEPTSVEKESAIIKQHEEGDYFYVLKSGTARFEVDGATVGQAKEGDSFGELALLYKAPRAASVIATSSPCKLYRLDQRTFRTILQSQTQQADSKKRELLKNISFLSELDEHDLNKLVQALTPRPFKKNEVLVKKGTQGDTFFVIQEGGVKVTNISIGGAKYEDQTLASGDYFGERALITSEPRSANCVATSDGIALTVDAETFQLVMGDFKRLVLKASDKRKLAAIPKFSSLLPADLTTLATSIAEKTYKKGDIIVKEAEENVSAVLYLVRDEGKIQVTSTSKKYSQTIESGGYFAEELNQLKKYEPTLTSAYTIKAVSDTTVGVLTASECRVLFDVAAIGSIRNKPPKKDAHQNIQYKDLKKHKILGAGTFGQVWLVSVKSPSGGGRTAYALKIQSKYDLVENDMAKGVVQEKNIMSELDHPFIIKLVNTYQDKQRVYMLVQLVQGGELYSVLHRPRSDGVPESQAKFYGATILAGLSYMHRRNIIYRDLKPENVLVGNNGYPVIIDMGFAKKISKKTYTFCGTPLYVAPEIILNKGHDKGADHWSLGCLIYEMIDGETPFYKEGMDQMTLFKTIVKGRYDKSSRPMSSEVQDFVKRILVTDSSRRLGSLAKGINDLFRHKWFNDMDFEKLQAMEVPAPFVPKIKDPLDCSAFDDWSHLDDKEKVKDPPISKKDDAIFKVF